MSIQVSSQIDQLAQLVSQKTGLDKNVILAQWHAEQGVSSISQWYTNNPAGITHGNSKVDALANGINKYGFNTFETAEKGALAYATLINTDPSYANIRKVVQSGGSVQDQLKAIVSSPWDAGHYGGDGSKLFSSYNSITGASIVNDGSISLTDSNSSSIGVSSPIDVAKKIGIYAGLIVILIFSLYVTFVAK